MIWVNKRFWQTAADRNVLRNEMTRKVDFLILTFLQQRVDFSHVSPYSTWWIAWALFHQDIPL